MFESLALENPHNTRRNWMTAVSFALQATGLGLLVLAPIGYTQAVAPRFAEHLVTPFGMTSVETEGRPETEERTNTAPLPFHETTVIHIGPGRNFHARTNPGPYTQPFDPNAPYLPGGPPRSGDGVPNWLLDGSRPVITPAPPSNTRTKPYPISDLNPGMLIKQVQPIYPTIAQQTRTEGKVVLVAVIDTQGRIENLRALSGHPFLVPAAINAVQQWRYRPYILNGQPVEVETQITVNFTLQHD